MALSQLNQQLLKLDLPKLFARQKILVVGDVMLDRYWFGDTRRISPEAPVPITKIEKTGERPGGAANVALNIAALSGQAELLAVTGEDEAAKNLERLLAAAPVKTHFVVDKKIKTTIKLRVVARGQQLIRLDFEDTPAKESTLKLTELFHQLVGQFDMIILSDYDKGVLKHVSTLIAAARAQKIPVLADPKGADFSKYRGATLLTPNRDELRAVVGDWHSEEELTQKAQNLRRELGLTTLLLTRSEEGLSFYQEGLTLHQGTAAKEVYDVSGAGDTVIAAAALGLTSKLAPDVLMRLANTAAGVVVAKVGTATATLPELLQKLNEM